MKILLICFAVFVGQMGTLQDKQVVHLQPNRDFIGLEYGGDLLEVMNAPAVITLPAIPPKLDSKGNPWSVEVKNLGPRAVSVVGKNQFSVPVSVGRTVQILSNGAAYSLKR
jgi:hypothetical protein